MKFTDANLVSSIVWQMRRADFMRGSNRAAIDRLFNGAPPLTEAEREAQQAYTNVNKLSGPKIAADARRTYSQAFFKSKYYFNVTLEDCKDRKKSEYESIITREIGRKMKRSMKYFEAIRSQIGTVVLHGISPVFWGDPERWCPMALSPGDVMIPSGTRVAMDNLTQFAVWRQFTPHELRKLAKSATPDPGWQQPTVDSAIAWCEQQIERGSMTSILPARDILAPERMQEWIKENTGLYASDSVPTIDAWEFYYYSDDDEECGWRRRIVLDTPYYADPMPNDMPERDLIGRDAKKRDFLYSSDNVYARNVNEILHFQFGDASSVAPYRYHSVRSLGWLLYSPAHLENRLFCKRADATFESLMQYFRVSNPEDKERVTKIDLHHLGVIPEGLNFVTPQERWQVNHTLVNETAAELRQSMVETAAQFREGREASAGVEKTATQVMAEVNSANAIVGAMLLQAYAYANQQYAEIARRFCVENSVDPEVRDFRAKALSSGVPEKYLDSSMWRVDAEQAMGAGNKLLQIAMADKLMAARTLYDPQAQRDILHIYTIANTDDAALSDSLVPAMPETSDTAHEADQSFATLLAGVQVRPKKGENQIEVIQAWIAGLVQRVQLLQQTGAENSDMAGIQNAIGATQQRIQMFAMDAAQVQLAKKFEDDLKQVAEAASGIRINTPQQGPDPETQAKIQSTAAQAQNKMQIRSAEAAQKMAIKNVAAQQDLQIQRGRAQVEIQKQATQLQTDLLEQGMRTGQEMRHAELAASTEDR
jgi:hypothetical protein